METSEAPQQRATERLTLAIEGTPDSGGEELARLTGQLRSQLLELDVERVDLIQAVIGLVQNWHKDHPASSIKVTLGEDSLELSNASPEQLEQLARAFIARHPTS